MLTKLLASMLGLAFLALAALGVLPNEWTGPDKALDFGAAQSVIHLIFGIFLLFGVWLTSHPRFVLRTLALLYVAVALIGVNSIGDKLLELFANVQPGRWLEVALATALVMLGFMAGNLIVRRPAKALAPAPVEAEDPAPEAEWKKAEAESREKAPPRAVPVVANLSAETAAASDISSTRLADRIEDSLGTYEAEKAAQDIGRPDDGDVARIDEDDDVREPEEKEKRGFSSLFGPKPQTQS